MRKALQILFFRRRMNMFKLLMKCAKILAAGEIAYFEK